MQIVSIAITKTADLQYNSPYLQPVVLQWQSSGKPVCEEHPNVRWDATGERIIGSQCASSGIPVVFHW